MIVGAMGFMFGTGGSALIAKTMGEGNKEKAQNIFSLVVFSTFITGFVVAVLSIIFLRPITVLLGAKWEMLNTCVLYGRVFLVALPFLMLQYTFSSLVVTDEKPKFGLIITIAAGFINMICDALFMAIFQWDVVGAALASALGQIVGSVVPLIYFAQKNSSLFILCKPQWDDKALKKVCVNDSSELMSNISMPLVSMLYNAQLMKYAGENGIAAYGTIMYVNFIFLAIFIGYSTGMAPVISYHYGAGNTKELKSLLKKSSVFLFISSVLMFVIAEFMGLPLAKIYVGYNTVLLEMTAHAFAVYAFSFLFVGFSIFGSAFFTALNDGLTSALISFLRTLLFQSAAVLILPLIWGLEGIWYSIVVAELMAILITIIFLFIKRKKYRYW